MNDLRDEKSLGSRSAQDEAAPMEITAISVLMASYNNSAYIQEAIESVLRQTSSSWELVILDDASTDNSIEIITPYLEHQRVRLIKHHQNQGYTRSLKDLISSANNDIVAILDSDDALAPHAIDRVIDAYESNPDVGFVFSNFAYCDPELNVTKAGFSTAIPQGKTNLHSSRISHLKTFRKRVYEKTEGYDESILYAEDKDLTYKMEEVGSVLFVDDILYYYRVLDHSQSRGKRNASIGITSHVRAITKAYSRRRSSEFPNLSESELLDKIRFHREQQSAQESPVSPLLRPRSRPFIIRAFRAAIIKLRIRRAYRFIVSQWNLATGRVPSSPDPGGFIVCHSKKFMFVAIAKNAVTSLKQIVLQHDYELEFSSDYEVVHDILGYNFDGYTRITLQEARKDCYRDYVKFAVYRDPIERMMSLYANKVAKGHPSKHHYFELQGVDGASLTKFLKFAQRELEKTASSQDEHVRPQNLYYQPEDVDYVVAQGDLDSFLKSKFSVQLESNLNKSTAATKIEASISDREVIKRMYKDDYLLRPETSRLT